MNATQTETTFGIWYLYSFVEVKKCKCPNFRKGIVLVRKAVGCCSVGFWIFFDFNVLYFVFVFVSLKIINFKFARRAARNIAPHTALINQLFNVKCQMSMSMQCAIARKHDANKLQQLLRTRLHIVGHEILAHHGISRWRLAIDLASSRHLPLAQEQEYVVARTLLLP